MNFINQKTFGIDLSSWLHHVPSLILAVVVIVIGIKLANHLAELSRKKIAESSHDPLMTNFLYKTIRLGLLILVIMYGMKLAGLGGIAAGILTAAGASAVIFGFAFKDIGENFISGVILSFNRPFKINDTILIDGIFGQILSMEFRYTKLKTFDGRDVYIPNSDVIKKPVFNYTEDGFCRMEFTVTTSNQNDIEKTEKIIIDALSDVNGLLKDQKHHAYTIVEDLLDEAIKLKVVFWVDSGDYRKEAMQIRSAAITAVKRSMINKISTSSG